MKGTCSRDGDEVTVPDITAFHYAAFGVALLLSTVFTTMLSPRRRKALGPFQFIFAWLLVAGPALFVAVCVRGGYALAFQEGGMNGVLAQLAGSGIGLGVLLLPRIGLMLFPPSAGLLKEWRRATWEASFLGRVFTSRVD